MATQTPYLLDLGQNPTLIYAIVLLKQCRTQSQSSFGCPFLSLYRKLFFFPSLQRHQAQLPLHIQVAVQSETLCYFGPYGICLSRENGGGETFMYIPRRYIHYSSCSHMRRSCRAAGEHPFVQTDKTQASIRLTVPTIRYMRKNKAFPAAGAFFSQFLCAVLCLLESNYLNRNESSWVGGWGGDFMRVTRPKGSLKRSVWK